MTFAVDDSKSLKIDWAYVFAETANAKTMMNTLYIFME